MFRKILTVLSTGLLAFGISGCTASAYVDTEYAPKILSENLVPGLDEEQSVMCSIQVTAGDTVLEGVLYDNPTARGFAGMLPLTADLWHPAPDFARAFDLPEQIAQKGSPGYEYELGSLAYWDAGPSIALIYKASREETVVPVVLIGKITSDLSVFGEYGDAVTITIVEDTEMAVGGEAMFTEDTRVWDVINDSVFGDYGRLIFPADKSINENLTLGNVGHILTRYSYVNPDRTVEIANYLREHAASGEQIFYDIYTEEEKAADPEKDLPSQMPAEYLPMWMVCMTASPMRWSCRKKGTMPLP